MRWRIALSSHCEISVLSVPHASLSQSVLQSRVRNACQLLVNGVLPSVEQTHAASSISPVWNHGVHVKGAPSLPFVGETQGRSSPLDGEHLVVLAMIKSRNGKTGVATVSRVLPGTSSEEWHHLVDPGTSSPSHLCRFSLRTDPVLLFQIPCSR